MPCSPSLPGCLTGGLRAPALPPFAPLAILAALLATTPLLAAEPWGGTTVPAEDLADVVGVAHVRGTYHHQDGDFLNEGAEVIADLGSRVIKLYLMLPPASTYPFGSEWPEVASLVELADTPHYREVFARPFSTFILTAYAVGRGDHYWLHGVTEAAYADEREQFYRLARHFLTEYRDSGKTFVLQHWEGDWAVRGSYDAERDPTPTAIEGMIRWLQARQEGVDRAREEVGEKGVRVLHAAEVNLVTAAMEEGRPSVTSDVLPLAGVDLVSYSAWETQHDAERLREALDFIARHAPRRPGIAGRHVFIGEFGLPENEHPPEAIRHVIDNCIPVGREWGCPYVVYWQVYCNEPRRQPVAANEDVRGFWLLRPDGSRGHAWNALRAHLVGAGGPGE